MHGSWPTVGIIAFLRHKHPSSYSDSVSSFVDGNQVILHVRAMHGACHARQCDYWYFQTGKSKIVEHWDVTQAIPEKTASDNPMF